MTQEFDEKPTLADGPAEESEVEEVSAAESGPEPPTIFEAPVVVGVDTPTGMQKVTADKWQFEGGALHLYLGRKAVGEFEAGEWLGCAATGEPVS